MLGDLIKRLSAVEVDLGGEKVAARVVTTAEQQLLEAMDPRPMPPLKRDPAKLKTAAPEPDENDPQHVQAESAWWVRQCLAVVAVGLGPGTVGVAAPWPAVTVAGVKDKTVQDAARVYLDAAVPIVEQLPWPVVAAASKVMRQGGDVLKDAEKNSPSPHG